MVLANIKTFFEGNVMSRLYGDKEDINSDKVKDFFNKRANKEFDSDLSIVLFQIRKIPNKGTKKRKSYCLKTLISMARK